MFGFLPGQAYLKSGLPIAPPDRGSTDDSNAHFLPTTMDVNLRARITNDFLPVANLRPVECDSPLVETTCIDTIKPKKRLAVPMMNFSGKKIHMLTVKINGIKKASSVRSVKQGTLKATVADDQLTVALPLDIADMLLIDL